MNWKAPFERGDGAMRRGRGSHRLQGFVSPTTSVAIVNISADGSTIVSMGTVDMGQAPDTTMAQIAAEVLGRSAGTVRVVHPDTDVTPYDMGTLGSRSSSTWAMRCGWRREDARARAAEARREAGLPAGTNYPPAEIFKKRYGMQAGNVIGIATYFRPTSRRTRRPACPTTLRRSG